MIKVSVEGDRMTISGHADEGDTEADNCGICAFTSLIAQSCAGWTKDDGFVYEDGNTVVKMPTGDVRDFVIMSLRGVAQAWPKLLSVEVVEFVAACAGLTDTDEDCGLPRGHEGPCAT